MHGKSVGIDVEHHATKGRNDHDAGLKDQEDREAANEPMSHAGDAIDGGNDARDDNRHPKQLEESFAGIACIYESVFANECFTAKEVHDLKSNEDRKQDIERDEERAGDHMVRMMLDVTMFRTTALGEARNDHGACRSKEDKGEDIPNRPSDGLLKVLRAEKVAERFLNERIRRNEKDADDKEKGDSDGDTDDDF